MPLRELAVVVLGGLALAPGALPGFAVWPPSTAALEFCALTVVAVLTGAAGRPRPTLRDWATVSPSFVVDLTALLLLGPGAALVVSGTSAAARTVTDTAGRSTPVATLPRVATALVAIGAAAFAYQWLGGATRPWPWQALPVAAATLSYCVAVSAAAAFALPMLARQPVSRTWPTNLVRGCPPYFIAASLAVGVVALIEHRLWAVMPGAAVPLYFGYRAYSEQVARRQQGRQCLDVIESLGHGVAAVDAGGVVTLWNGALERLAGCGPEGAVGRPLFGVLPSLAGTDLPRAMREAARTGQVKVSRLGMAGGDGARMLEVRILPAPNGLTLDWCDVTESWRAEHRLKRSEERFALVGDAANDGLWEWDLRTNELYASARWRALVGLAGPADTGRPQEWLDRVHADDLPALRAALDNHIAGVTETFQHDHRLRVADGSYRLFQCRAVSVRGPGRRAVRIAGSLTDTTERAAVEEQLRSAGSTDPLTGLCNRAVFIERLGRRLEESKARHGTQFAALYLDLDRFKVINDSLGHIVGDQLLTIVSRRIEACLRPGDVLARLGGDEFAVLLNALSDEGQANVVALRIQEGLKTPMSIGGREVFTSASIGIAFGGPRYDSPDDIMRDADTAMYHAKARGKARHELFDADMHAREQDRLGLENDLRHAIERREVEMHYQPIVSLESGKCVGVESLVRWTRNGKPVSPATFIPIAEELGLIEPLGSWVLQQACSTFAQWRRRFPESGLDHVTVNVSSRQLMQQNFLSMVEQAVGRAGMKPCELRLEITETALMDSPAAAATLLGQLREFGVKIYLDDFGTGFSSLSHLHKLPVDALKIDRSFVTSLLLPERPAIVESILALARTLKTSVVAEGIENAVQAKELERLGCTHAQGFLFSRPLSIDSVEDVLQANRPLGPKGSPAPDLEMAKAENPELFFCSKPFEWPDEAQQPDAAAATESESSALVVRVLPPASVADPGWWG